MTKESRQSSAADDLLAPVLERLREESRVDVRVAREDFSRQIEELQRRQRTAFAIAFAVFALACAGLILTAWLSLAALFDKAEDRGKRQEEALLRLERLEEEARAHLEAMDGLERRLKVEILDRSGREEPAPASAGAQQEAPAPPPSEPPAAPPPAGKK
ncbi:MAG: hypothetical protein AB1405_09540 [Bdellovibrionota bacterium]